MMARTKVGGRNGGVNLDRTNTMRLKKMDKISKSGISQQCQSKPALDDNLRIAIWSHQECK